MRSGFERKYATVTDTGAIPAVCYLGCYCYVLTSPIHWMVQCLFPQESAMNIRVSSLAGCAVALLTAKAVGVAQMLVGLLGDLPVDHASLIDTHFQRLIRNTAE
jgi:hypothetical protein